MTKYIFICFCLLCSSVYADKIYQVPERILNMTGADVHISQGDLLYKSQAAGYYTGGGGVIVRSPITSTKFAGVALPKIQSGCGGIDIYTGGFSFIKKEELIQALQSISSNAAGYAFMLGIETVSPTIANNIKQMQSWANTINGIGINSCETAAQLTGSLWPRNEMASQHICRSIGTTGTAPLFEDYIEGRHHCNANNGHQKRIDVKKLAPLIGDYNVAWQALKTMPLFKTDNKELAEMYMTLVGTVIVKDALNDVFTPPLVYAAKAEDIEFLRQIMEGGKISKYACKDDQCLTIVEKEEDLTEKGWCARIRRSLQSMQEKAINDESLSDEEKGLLATTRLPLYKLINVIAAYRRGRIYPFDIQSIADVVTWDVMSQIINEAIESTMKGCMQLRNTKAYTTDVDDYVKKLERLKKIVVTYEEKTHRIMDLEMRLVEKIRLLESQINSEIMVN